jgi:hypothetical protein
VHPGVRLTVAAAVVGWMAFWFWAFSFAFSDSFFQYNRHSRIPPFLAVWLASGLIPWCAWLQWRARRSLLRTVLYQVAAVGFSLSLPFLVTGTLHHAPEPWHLSGDDAMGVGIDLLILCGLGLTSVAVLGVGLAFRHLARPREGVTS